MSGTVETKPSQTETLPEKIDLTFGFTSKDVEKFIELVKKNKRFKYKGIFYESNDVKENQPIVYNKTNKYTGTIIYAYSIHDKNSWYTINWYTIVKPSYPSTMQFGFVVDNGTYSLYHRRATPDFSKCLENDPNTHAPICKKPLCSSCSKIPLFQDWNEWDWAPFWDLHYDSSYKWTLSKGNPEGFKLLYLGGKSKKSRRQSKRPRKTSSKNISRKGHKGKYAKILQ